MTVRHRHGRRLPWSYCAQWSASCPAWYHRRYQENYMDGRDTLYWFKVNIWNNRVTEWTPREWKRRQGRTKTRWRDNLIRHVGPAWPRITRDRCLWRQFRDEFLPTEWKKHWWSMETLTFLCRTYLALIYYFCRTHLVVLSDMYCVCLSFSTVTSSCGHIWLCRTYLAWTRPTMRFCQ